MGLGKSDCLQKASSEFGLTASIFLLNTKVCSDMQAEPAHKEAVRGIAFSPSDLKFATCSDDSTIKAG